MPEGSVARRSDLGPQRTPCAEAAAQARGLALGLSDQAPSVPLARLVDDQNRLPGVLTPPEYSPIARCSASISAKRCLTMSPIEMMPPSRPPSTTGTCRTF